MARRPVSKQEETKKVAIPRCKYAGDPNDEYCKDCSGITMRIEDNGPEIPCDECGGYEPSDDETAETPEATFDETITEELPINAPEEEEIPFKPQKPVEPQPTKKSATNSQPATASGKITNTPPATNEKAVNSNETNVGNNNYQSVAVTTEIKAESGVSLELKDKNGVTRWYKFSYSETRTVPANADIEAEKNKLWNDVNATVDDQVNITIDFLNS